MVTWFQFPLWRLLYATTWFCIAAWSVSEMRTHWIYGGGMWYAIAFGVAGVRAIIAQPKAESRAIAARQKVIFGLVIGVSLFLALTWLPICELPRGTMCRPMGEAMVSLMFLLPIAALGLVIASDQVVATWPKPWKGVVAIVATFVPLLVYVLSNWLILHACGIIYED